MTNGEFHQLQHGQHERDEIFRSVFEASSDAMALSDAHGIVLNANPAYFELYGYSADEIIGQSFNIIFPEAQRTTALEQYHQIFHGQWQAAAYETEIVRKDGTTRSVQARTGFVTHGGQRTLMLSVIRDVTEQKQAQTTLERYMADLQRSNAELDQFAAIASHDLQEPLRMITSYLQLLKLQYDDRLDATGREFLNFALDGADRMNLLIKGFLTYARVRTDESEFIEFSSEKALQSALSNLRGQLAESQAKITHDALPEVRGDETLFIRLLQNLLSNAMKFRGEAPPEIHITARRDGEEWLFAVSDNGIGIEQEDLDRIFGMFQRVHSSEAYLGTGIGLAICKKVVDYHRGRLWAESSIGKGTTFYFTIPAAPAVNGQSL